MVHTDMYHDIPQKLNTTIWHPTGRMAGWTFFWQWFVRCVANKYNLGEKAKEERWSIAYENMQIIKKFR